MPPQMGVATAGAAASLPGFDTNHLLWHHTQDDASPFSPSDMNTAMAASPLDDGDPHVEEKSDSKLPAIPPRPSFCPICLEDLSTQDDAMMLALQCGHSFCKDCWHGFVEQMLSETYQAAMSTTCPAQGCPILVDRMLIQKIDQNFVHRFDKHQLHSFVQGNRQTVRWCPGLDCECAVVMPPDNFFPNEDDGEAERHPNVFCESCQTTFCFHCGLAPHFGDCEHKLPGNKAAAAIAAAAAANAAAAAAAAIDREATRQLTSTSDDKMRKHCPKCNVLVEKIGGCNRMVCKCRHPFCWLCLGDFQAYGGHFCGRVPEEAVTIMPDTQTTGVSVDLGLLRSVVNKHKKNADALVVVKKLRALDRYVHYFTRYLAHDQGQRFAEQQCPCLKTRAENYKEMTGIDLEAEVDFIRSANETLVASRRLLKYAYCCVYHSKRVDEKDTDHLHLGFLHIERLERFTEELSELTENAVTRQDRKSVLDLTDVVKQCMEAVNDFEALESALAN